jgi:ApbE superfamily uncharacterized protein (UPF0280 family)
MSRAQVTRLAGGWLHLNDGPIDLVIHAEGEAHHQRAAEAAAVSRFAAVLDELCAELPLLRAATAGKPSGPVARRMWHATRPFAGETFITPMAAVAGSVAEDILAAMLSAAPLRRAFVNNGGDIALALSSATSCRIGLVDRPDCPSLFANSEIKATDPVRGIATSGWRGRSFSLGIADAVTVLAATAAMADAAATIIANAVDCPGHPGIERRPASDLQPDSDLGERPVTVAVAGLTPRDIAEALDGGERMAHRCLSRGLITACALHLAGETRTVGGLLMPRRAELIHA